MEPAGPTAVSAPRDAVVLTDALTGLKSRDFFHELLEREHRIAVRYRTPLSLLLLDIDGMQDFNDAFGHAAGDAALQTVAGLLTRGSRDTDAVARYGGEEFVLLLAHTDGAGALTIADRLRRSLERTPWPLRPVTASIGVAWLLPGTSEPGQLISDAETALYAAKNSGRNRVISSADAIFATR